MIIAIANQKGGVGKSTTADAIASGLRAKGKKTLLIDLDPQGNLTYTTGLDDPFPTSYELLAKEVTVEECIVSTDSGDLLPASSALAGADAKLQTTGKEYRLKEALTPMRDQYDLILIDTPPALGILTVNALTAADALLIPAQADIYSLQGIGQLYETVTAIQSYTNANLHVLGIVLTRYNSRTVLSRDLTEVMEETAKELGTKVYKQTIRESVVIREAQAGREPLFSYAPNSSVAEDYRQFIDELKEDL